MINCIWNNKTKTVFSSEGNYIANITEENETSFTVWYGDHGNRQSQSGFDNIIDAFRWIVNKYKLRIVSELGLF